MREKGTEAPFSGKFLAHDETGVYTCAGCGNQLFGSDTKYESTTPGLIGWPSFSDAISQDKITLTDDTSLGMHRIEVMCALCGGHLGHLFDDDTSPNGKHYCINSAALDFKKK